jgi:hypothetical protein
VDESATGSVNFCARISVGRAALTDRIALVHLRMPSIDQGVQAFIWALIFFVYLWLGMLAVGVDGATAFILSLVVGAAVWLLVRTRGGDKPRRYGSYRS